MNTKPKDDIFKEFMDNALELQIKGLIKNTRQQIAQEIFKEIDDCLLDKCKVIRCEHYNKIKQKYLGDKG